MHFVGNGIWRRSQDLQEKTVADKRRFDDQVINVTGKTSFFQARHVTINKLSRRILMIGKPIMQEFLRGCSQRKKHQRKTCE